MSGGVERYGRTISQRLGNDSVYGQGTDGDATISTNTTLSGDVYYNNLTVNSGVTLLLNGYRLFVKGTLTNNGFIGVGTNSAGVPSGDIASGTAPGTNSTAAVTYAVGGLGGRVSTANVAPSWVLQDIRQTLDGISTADPSQNPGTAYKIVGGSAGDQGPTNYTVNSAPTTWTGKAGSAGNPGSGVNIGGTHYPSPNANTVGAQGGKGATGNDGTTVGWVAGSNGAAGSGGRGGGVAIIIAKIIAGTGTIFSLGNSGNAGSPGTTGNPGTAGTAGASAPNLVINSGQSGGNTTIAGCNAHSGAVNTANCNAHAQSNHHYQGNAHHHYVAHTLHHYCTQHHPNGSCINHTGHHHTHNACCVRENTHYRDNAHYCSGNHNATHANHICNVAATYVGGTGGAGGVAAPADTGATGAYGGAGGGGGILIITDSTPTGQTYNVAKGAIDGRGNATDGTTYVILNS